MTGEPPPRPPVEPMPPVAAAALPWDEDVADPVAALAAARAEHGDTFLVAGPRTATLFLLSPEGVRSFYAVPEVEASKGYADWTMLRRKLPDELFDGRRTTVHELFGRDDVQAYLRQLDTAIEVSLAELGDAGEVDLFAFTRRLGHRLGLACWAGEDPVAGAGRFDDLVAALDTLDASAAFVDPGAMRAVAAAGKAAEREALARLEDALAATVARRDADRAAGGEPAGDLFDRVVDRWADTGEPARSAGIARDVVLLHLASMSNLFAALGWMLAHLALHPEVVERVRAGEEGLLDRCALESIRLGQRSIMLRRALVPTAVHDERRAYVVAAGHQIATLLPLTNTTAAPGLAGYDPDRWSRRRLRDESALAARELVTTFGHGEHACPAQPFSLAAMGRAAARLFGERELVPRFASIEPLPGQIGGVARPAAPCVVSHRRR